MARGIEMLQAMRRDELRSLLQALQFDAREIDCYLPTANTPHNETMPQHDPACDPTAPNASILPRPDGISPFDDDFLVMQTSLLGLAMTLAGIEKKHRLQIDDAGLVRGMQSIAESSCANRVFIYASQQGLAPDLQERADQIQAYLRTHHYDALCAHACQHGTHRANFDAHLSLIADALAEQEDESYARILDRELYSRAIRLLDRRQGRGA